jgi:cobyrinic acid a,c-diamide synthase
LTSRVLAGVITDRRYELQKDDGDLSLYEVEYIPNGSKILRTTQSVKLTMVKEASFERGATYSVKGGEFHSSHVSENTSAATLVKTSNHRNDSPYVVGEFRDGDVEYSYYRETVEYETFVELCQRILLGTGVQ